MSSTGERPLGDVLHRFREEFEPARQYDYPPWHQPTLPTVELVGTCNLVEVNLDAAGRVEPRGLERLSATERDVLEPTDWRRGPGRGVPS